MQRRKVKKRKNAAKAVTGQPRVQSYQKKIQQTKINIKKAVVKEKKDRPEKTPAIQAKQHTEIHSKPI